MCFRGIIQNTTAFCGNKSHRFVSGASQRKAENVELTLLLYIQHNIFTYQEPNCNILYCANQLPSRRWLPSVLKPINLSQHCSGYCFTKHGHKQLNLHWGSKARALAVNAPFTLQLAGSSAEQLSGGGTARQLAFYDHIYPSGFCTAAMKQEGSVGWK